MGIMLQSFVQKLLVESECRMSQRRGRFLLIALASGQPWRLLFDHFVGAGQQLCRHGEAEHRGGLGVDDQLEFGRLHNRQVRGLGTLKDATDIGADLAPRIRNVGSIAHQPTGFGKVARGI